MTPNFALSLSFDGIRLLHRVSGGWHLVGEAALDDPKLNDALATLRKTATALESAGLRTKLLIPNEQIKYLAIDSTQTSIDDINAALDGATPYAIDELAIDFDRSGGRTHIAAVARETLEEAEAFAMEHDFAPVSFAAIAPPYTFSTEVFFGPSKAAADILEDPSALTRDPNPVSVIGAASLPALADPVIPLATVTHQKGESDPGQQSAKAEPKIDATTTEQNDEASEQPVPEIVFASRARPETSPLPAPRVRPDPPEHTPPVPDAAADAPALFTRRIDVPTETTSPPLMAGPLATAQPASSVTGESATLSAQSPQAQKPRAATAPAFDAQQRRGKPRFLGLILTAALLLILFLVALWASTLSEDGIAGWFDSEPAPDAPVVAAAPNPSATQAEQSQIAERAPVPETTPEPVPMPLLEEAEAAVATVVIPLQEQAAPLPAPQSPNGSLPILRAAVGRVLSPAEADRIYAATGVYQRAPRLPLTPRDSTMDGMQRARILSDYPPKNALILPDVEAMLPDYALPGQPNPPPPGTTYQRDLRGFILAMPDGTITPDGVLIFAGRPEFSPPLRPGTVVRAPVGSIADGRTRNSVPGLRLVAGPPPIRPPLRPNGAAPQTDAPEDAPVTQDDASQSPALLLASPQTAELIDASPSEPDPNPVAPIPDVTVAEAPDLPLAITENTLATTPETIVGATAPAPIADTASTPEGLRIITGRPNLVPPLRPAAFSSRTVPVELLPQIAEAGTSAPSDTAQATTEVAVAAIVVNPTDTLTASGAALASFRPATRPAGLAPEPTIDLLASADPALAGVRPLIRPDGLAPEPEPAEAAAIAAAVQSASTADINTVIANLAQVATPPSPLAVARSIRPDARPRNFATVVARTLQTAAPRTQTTTQASAVRSAPATPSGPIPGGVARAATLDNAIQLREINLIGVYGRAGDRRALVRLSNGRYVKVEIGSDLDGGRVTAIGDSALNYVKRGRTYALQMPAG